MTVPPSSATKVAVGWGLPRCDNDGSRFYPVATKVPLPSLTFSETWTTVGDVALTGDIDSDGHLELFVGNGTTLEAYCFDSTAAGVAPPESSGNSRKLDA